MAALTVYFDDSGTHPGTPSVTVAGWIAHVAQWKRFSRQWNKARKEYGFNAFHMSEFLANNPKSEYADKKKWDEKAQRRLIKVLREITNSRVAKGFAMSVARRDYDELISNSPNRNSLIGLTGAYHYTYAVRCAIGFIEGWRIEQGISEPIEYIFDRMAKGKSKNEIDSVFSAAENEADSLHRYGIYKGCHSFRDKEELLPLQAADLLAYSVFQRDHYRLTGKEMNAITRESFKYFIQRKLSARFQNRKELEDVVAGIEARS